MYGGRRRMEFGVPPVRMSQPASRQPARHQFTPDPHMFWPASVSFNVSR